MKESHVSSIVTAIVWKDNWRQKINDKTITDKWSLEAESQGASKQDFNTALDILKNMAANYIDTSKCCCDCHNNNYDEENSDSDDFYNDECSGRCRCTHNNCSNKCDHTKEFEYKKSLFHRSVQEKKDLIPKILTNAFASKMNELMDDQKGKEDWHPGSKKQVLDLIHPSLYCYVKGVSKLINGKPEQIAKDKINELTRYQWLPAEFSHKDGKVNIDTYINNLDRNQYHTLYDLIAKIFGKFIPMFEKTLDRKLPENLQVIVKAANIVIQPGQKYDGGVWHLEGMPYERIVATGIYYYHMENIKNSGLDFRRAIEEYFDYPQDGEGFVEKHYGLQDEDQLNEYLGQIVAEEGKCITFPNYLQHRVTPFQLKDESKPGIRKILVFFLIDPDDSILSTKDVPIQQNYVIKQKLNNIFDEKKNVHQRVRDNIYDKIDAITFEEAKKHREALMFQRKYYVDEINKNIFEREFSLCEH